MGKNIGVKFQEEFESLTSKFAEMYTDIRDKEKIDVHIDKKEYEDFYKVLIELIYYNECMIKFFYNDFVSKKDKIDTEEFWNETQDEEQKIAKIREEHSEYRGSIESDLYRLVKCNEKVHYLYDNNKMHINDKTVAKCRKRIRISNSLETIGDTVGTVFKKTIIPAVSKGTKLAKEGYYAGMDELGKKADVAYDNFYKEMKSKPTSTLLDYYHNRDLNDYQFSIIEQVLDERGAL